MSPTTDAKRGAQPRRKSKRGGGGIGSLSVQAGTPGRDSGVRTVNIAPSAVELLSADRAGSGTFGRVAAVNGETPVNCTQFTEGLMRSQFAGALQMPFTFGLNQKAPFPSEARCLLCRGERKDSSSPDCWITGSTPGGFFAPPKSTSLLQLPLWVCHDCRSAVGREERHSVTEHTLPTQDFLLHVPVGTSGMLSESVAPGQLVPTAASLPTPDSSSLPATEGPCSCGSCSKQREMSADVERESVLLHKCWSEVRYMVRCIYRQTGTPLAESQDLPQDQEKEGMKELVDRLCRKDPYQLYQRLEQQAREYVLEVRDRLLKHLPPGPRDPAGERSRPEAHHFLSVLLVEYSALCQAARTISTFLPTLENQHLKRFHVTWELHDKHLFEKLVFSEPLLCNSWPSLVAQLRQGASPQYSFGEGVYATLLQRCQQLEQEMAKVATQWLECEKLINDYVDQQLLFKAEGQNHTTQRTPHTSLISRNTSLKAKHRTLKDDWEFFKQQRFIEEQLTNSKTSLMDGGFTETVRDVLSSRLSIPDCANCSCRRRCTCDDCSLSQILACGATDSHIEPTGSFLSEEHHPASGSPITHQHPCILRNDCSPPFGSNGDAPALPKSFADVYPLSNYPRMGSILNGACRGKEVVLKDESPPVSRSCSSSEADEEEGNRESSEESPPGKRSPMKDKLRNGGDPPSYLNQQAERLQHPCECHVCKQEVPGPTGTAGSLSGRLHANPHFFPENTSHPALHLYPHIHGKLPLHSAGHLPRPLLCPTAFPNTSFAHSKMLPSVLSSDRSGKQQTLSPSLPEHVYQNCFTAMTPWGRNPHCQPLKLENIWDTTLKSWNPTSFFEEPLPGVDSYRPALLETPLATPFPSSTDDPLVPLETKEKKNVKKKHMYGLQEVIPEASRVVMATSSATSSVSSTATTVQSSSSQIKVSSKRPDLLGDIFHSVVKEEHKHTNTAASRSSPTGLCPLPTLSAPCLSSSSAPHLPAMDPQRSPKEASTAPGFLDAHSGLLPLSRTEGSVSSAPPSVCSDPDCDAHRCEGSGAYDHRAYDGEDSQDEDSCSEHSSSTSTSTNQKEGKYCDCCYCEFFGHGGPPAAPTSRNYAEMREKLRLRLTKRKEEQPKREDQQVVDRENVEDHRNVDELLQFINSEDAKPTSSSRAAKRARHKQRKMEERTRLEEEARERERQELLAKDRQRNDEALKQEILRQLQAAKKKRKDQTREAPGLQSPRLLKESAQHALESLLNGKAELLAESTMGNGDSNRNHLRQLRQLLTQKAGKDKLVEVLPIAESPSWVELSSRPTQSSGLVGDAPAESGQTPKMTEAVAPLMSSNPPLETRPLPSGSLTSKSSCRKQTETVLLGEKMSPVVEATLEHEQRNGKTDSAESPQPKNKAKNKKKKKGEKLNSYIDDVFLPKDIDLNSVEMDETEREVEYFKRFCLDSARQTRQRLSINWSNFNFKKATFAGH
ncbi:protein FAM193A-like isoform X2 [Scleropages formosus]|uniref:protein FAM193A-like isoform X2 n=1 Tax=Scleropages formosus TaxID=113540 RepID=UPI0010FA9A69|nr:protein FAM193A-like isoform X2 [Scleropages formosus]